MTTTKQAPIHSGYGPQTIARDVIANRDLTGITAVVTGGYAGIGLETTRALVGAGATVIVGTRTLDKARASLAGVARVEIEALDLIDPASVDAFAARVLASGRPLRILVNNAGIMAPPLARDSRGYESQLATNHIGHFQLTARLWPALRRAPGARVVALTSRGHARSAVDFDSPQLDGMGGVYCEDADVAQAVPGDFPQQRGVRPWAMDPTSAERLWTKTEEWTGVRFPS